MGLVIAALGGCSDPPDPEPAAAPIGIPQWSTAPYVQWTGPDDPITRPLAVLIDQPGGPLDQIAADPDVTSFLNDRFHPWFIIPEQVQHLSAGQALFLNPEGCVLSAISSPQSPLDWIDSANSALLENEQPSRKQPLEVLPIWAFSLPESHALYGKCTR